MRAGFLTVDISPTRPAPLAGFAARVGDFAGADAPLEANLASVVDEAGQRVVLGSVDTLFVGATTHAAIAAAAGIAPERLVLVASHTHNAPSLAPEVPQLGALDPAYRDMVVQRLAEAVRRLAAGPAQPVSVGYAERHAPYNINRRKPAWVLDYPALRRERRLRFGREIALAPHRAGIVDQTLRCIVLREGATVRAVIWAFACHANRYPSLHHVSPDFPGLVRDRLRARFGRGCAVLYLPGLAGSAIADIPFPIPRTVNEFLRIALPFNPYVPWFTPDSFRAWGDRLAATATDCAEAARPADGAEPRHRHGRTAPVFHGTPEIALDLVHLDFGPACGLVAMTGEVIGEWGPILAPHLPPGRIATGYLAGPCLYVPTDGAVREGGYEADRFRGLFDLDGTFIPDLDRTVGRAVAELLAERPGSNDLQPARQERRA